MPPTSSALYQKKVNSIGQYATSQQKYAYEQRQNSNPDLQKHSTNDTFFNVGSFNDAGIASFDIPEEAGKIWVLRIQIHAALKTWVLIQKVSGADVSGYYIY